MSHVLYNKIVAKLDHLNEYLGYLKVLQKINKKAFLEDYHHFGLAERYLQLSIEVVLDIAKLFVARLELPKPDSNQEFIFILRNAKIISKKTAERVEGIIGFRNVLVHDYEKIDRTIIYEKLQTRLDDFVVFRKEIMAYLKKNY